MSDYSSLDLLSQVLASPSPDAGTQVKWFQLASNCDVNGLIAAGFTPKALPDLPSKQGYRKAEIPSALRKRVFERDGYRCVTCGGWKDLCADHIIPESKGGPTTLENLQTMCHPCNSEKGARQ